jgi:hypothetical protein
MKFTILVLQRWGEKNIGQIRLDWWSLQHLLPPVSQFVCSRGGFLNHVPLGDW